MVRYANVVLIEFFDLQHTSTQVNNGLYSSKEKSVKLHGSGSKALEQSAKVIGKCSVAVWF